MEINSNVSFKGYVPVTYYAKDPLSNDYLQVVDYKNIRKCHGFLIRNLNGTLKNNRREDLVDYYSARDSDFKSCRKATSIYDKDTPTVFLVTGKDVDIIENMAKPIGVAKSNAIDKLGHTKSFEVADKTNTYFRDAKSFLKNTCHRLKAKDGSNLSLKMYFEPQYNKKDEFKGFQFVSAQFEKEKK